MIVSATPKKAPETFMEDEEMETPAVEENEELELDLGDDTEEEEETVESLRQKLDEERKAREKAEEIASDRKIRAEKAEAKAKAPPANAPSKKADIDYLDMYALQTAQVPVEDVAQVIDYAKYKKISIADALKDNVVKTMLSDAQETRKTASVANTGATRRGNQTKTPEVIYEKAVKGEFPESDADFDALVAGRISSGAFSKRR